MAKPPKLPQQQTTYTKLVGVTFNNRQKPLKRCTPSQTLVLIREHDNPTDRNAVTVCVPGGLIRKPKMLGYIDRDLSRTIAKHLHSGIDVGVTVEQVTGGGGMLWWKKSYGLNVSLTIPPG